MFILETIYNYYIPVPGNSNEIRPSDLYSAFTHNILQSFNNIYSNHFYIEDNIFPNDDNLINFCMTQDKKIKTFFQRYLLIEANSWM